ncbi:MAG: hypothetical protein E7331_04230 [Clostridiales bacterium]|nr:hypothetical protein [Clostridiales bacterium]
MFFCFGNDDRVMICAEKRVFPEMVEMEVPEGFEQDYQGDWKLAGDKLHYDPLPREQPAPTDRQRIEALEEENRFLKEALELLLSGETEEAEGDG